MSPAVRRPTPSYWSRKRVLLTGHTGFKGGWAALWLNQLGAKVTGLALPPETDPSLFGLTDIATRVDSRFVDLRDQAGVAAVVRDAAPEIVIHMAAQPIVRRSIVDPVETIAANVLGTAHLLDALRSSPDLTTVLVITSDKVYANDDSGVAFAENAPLGGKDPYSASKASAEIVTRSFAQTYFDDRGVVVATARGGNVVGGGDYAVDRIVPDIVRAASSGTTPVFRMPDATRPWQHVLDCVSGYLCYCETLHGGGAVPRALNFGPVPGHDVTVAQLGRAMLTALGRAPDFDYQPVPGAKEMKALAVDSSLARSVIGWSDLLAGEALVQWTADWYKRVMMGQSAFTATVDQIAAYANLRGNAP